MTEEDTTTTEPTDRAGNGVESTGSRVRRGVDYLLLAGLAAFALVAAVGFYTATGNAIRTWVTPEFRPVVTAAFNLVVLLVVGAGLVRQIRRLA